MLFANLEIGVQVGGHIELRIEISGIRGEL